MTLNFMDVTTLISLNVAPIFSSNTCKVTFPKPSFDDILEQTPSAIFPRPGFVDVLEQTPFATFPKTGFVDVHE